MKKQPSRAAFNPTPPSAAVVEWHLTEEKQYATNCLWQQTPKNSKNICTAAVDRNKHTIFPDASLSIEVWVSKVVRMTCELPGGHMIQD